MVKRETMKLPFLLNHDERPSANLSAALCRPCGDEPPRSVGRLYLVLAGLVPIALFVLSVSAFTPTATAAPKTDLVLGQIVAASDSESADSDVTWTYELDSSEDAVITGYELKSGVTQISIPETIEGHRVGAVADGVFSGDTQIVKVIFPPTVVRLGEHLFENCTSLTYADLKDVEELAEIPNSCFNGCAALESVDIPASVTSINLYAFSGCACLKQANIPPASRLGNIGPFAFYNCVSLESLDLPASLQSIEMYAFDSCASIASIRFRGTSMTRINGNAFSGCSALEELYLPDHVSEIYTKAFANCTSLKVVAFGKELPQMLARDVFDGCDAIELMVFPMVKGSDGGNEELSDADKEKAGWKKGVTQTVHIFYDDDDNAVIGIIHATSRYSTITLPATIGSHDIVTIGDWAANGETTLTKLVFPENCKIATIEFEAFENCTSLESITIPASVGRIESAAFKGCTSLTSVTFNTQNLASLGGATFKGCTSLESITLPEGMTTLYEQEFYNCTKLKDVYLPDTMTNIGANAFGCDEDKHMAIETMRMPNSSGDLNTPSDTDFFGSWITGSPPDSYKFQVTYGSTADFVWFEPHMTHSDSGLKDYNREYVPVAIGDKATHQHEANDVELTWDKRVSWTGDEVIPKVTATRWWRASPIGDGDGNLTVEPVLGYDCASVGKQKIVVTGNAPYFTGYRILEYEIVKLDVDDVRMGPISPDCVWDNKKWEPDPEFYLDRNATASSQGAKGDGGDVYRLVKDQDYTIIEYEHNKMAGDKASITIEGKGNFQGKKSFTFTIYPANLENTQVKVADQVYTGKAVTAVPSEVMLLDRSGKDYTVKLDEGVDYAVDPEGYRNNTNVGVATMTIRPVDDCTWLTGSKEVTFNIVKADLSKATVEAVPDQTYTGSDITPTVAVSSGDTTFEEGKDYDVAYAANRNVGTARVTIAGKGGCTGKKTMTFEIVPKPATITVADASKVRGEPDPTFTGTVEGLVAAGDLGEVRYVRTNDDEAAGTYEGVLDATYTPNPNYDVSVARGDFTIKRPDYIVRFDANVPASASTTCAGSMGDERLAYDERKALSPNGYSLPGYDFGGWNTKADGTGTAYADGAEVQGLLEDGGTVVLYAQWDAKPYTIEFWSDDAGSLKHSQTAYFDQTGQLETYSEFGWNITGKTLHGWRDVAFGSFLEDGEDFCNLCGAPDADGSVTDVVLTADWVQGEKIIVTVTKDGAPQEGLFSELTLLAQDSTSYSVPFKDEKGKYVFDPADETGQGAPTKQLAPGKYTLQFSVSGYPPNSAEISYGGDNAVSVVFDYYTVSLAKDPIYADANDVKIEGGEPVAGKANTVVARDDDTLVIETAVNEGYRFTGYTAVGVAPVWGQGGPTKVRQAITAQGKVDIMAHVAPIDYTVTVEGGTADKTTAHVGDTISITADAPEAGKAFVQWEHVDGVDFGNASSTATSFTMPAKDVTAKAVVAPIVIGDIGGKVYTGSPIEPADEVTVSLDGVDLALTADDYTVSFAGNVDAGDAKVIVAMREPRAGRATATFEILPADISGATVEVAGQVYDGTEHRPAPAVTWSGKTLVAGKDYEVTGYTGNVHAGTATVAVAGRGNFEGTASGTFEVARRPATITVNSSSKVQGEADPAFIGTVEGLVAEGDLGKVAYRRTNYAEAPGTYRGVLGATYAANADYDVSVEKGDFTIRRRLTAVWLDGDGSVLQAKDYGEGDEPPAYDGKEPTKAATAQHTYTFAGWDEGSVDGTTTTYRPLFSQTTNKGTLTFDLGGGTLDGKTSFTMEANVGDVITMPATPTREGYTFLYWKGSKYYPGDKYTVTGNHAFTAVWQKNTSSSTASGKSTSSSTSKVSTPSTADTTSSPAILLLAAVMALAISRRLRAPQ